MKNHRAQIRAALGFREPTVGDEGMRADWLASEVCPAELNGTGCGWRCWPGAAGS